jgi:signal transduction histidine kinase
LLIQPDSEVMRFAAAYGQAEQDREMLRQLIVPLAGSIAGSVALSGQALVSNDVATDPRFYAGISDTVEIKTRSLLAVPMMADDEAIGALEVINQRYDDGFDEADVEILTLFANQAAIAIQNARLLAERQASLTELTKLEQRKSQFIALASHELRTPLNLISGYSSLLRSSLPDCHIDADHEVMDFLGQIDEATSRLTGMVNNITSLYNLETGRTQLLLEKRDVIPIINEVLAEYREWGRKKGINFRCQLPTHPLYAT